MIKANLTDEQWQTMVMDSILQVQEANGSDAIYASEVFDECPITQPNAFNDVLVQLKRAGKVSGKLVKDSNGGVIDIIIKVIGV